MKKKLRHSHESINQTRLKPIGVAFLLFFIKCKIVSPLHRTILEMYLLKISTKPARSNHFINQTLYVIDFPY